MLSTETGLTCFVRCLCCKFLFGVQVGQVVEGSMHQFCSGTRGYVSPGRRLAVKCLYLDVIVNICIGTGL